MAWWGMERVGVMYLNETHTHTHTNNTTYITKCVIYHEI